MAFVFEEPTTAKFNDRTPDAPIDIADAVPDEKRELVMMLVPDPSTVKQVTFVVTMTLYAMIIEAVPLVVIGLLRPAFLISKVPAEMVLAVVEFPEFKKELSAKLILPADELLNKAIPVEAIFPMQL